MTSLALRPLLAGRRVDASQTEMRALLTTRLPVTSHFPPFARVARFRYPFLRLLLHGSGSYCVHNNFVEPGASVSGWSGDLGKSCGGALAERSS
jgi:hypothetical protein